MKKLAVTVLVPALALASGCATRGHNTPRQAAEQALYGNYAECITETAIDTACFDSGDFARVQGIVRWQCRKYENMIIDQFHNKAYASSSLESTFAKGVHDATASALSLLSDKKAYFAKFFTCIDERVAAYAAKKSMNNVMENLVSVSKTETTACYDSVLAPYIGKKSNEYSARRREGIIGGASEAYVKLIKNKARKRQARPTPDKLPKRPPRDGLHEEDRFKVWKL